MGKDTLSEGHKVLLSVPEKQSHYQDMLISCIILIM